MSFAIFSGVGSPSDDNFDVIWKTSPLELGRQPRPDQNIVTKWGSQHGEGKDTSAFQGRAGHSATDGRSWASK